jgi:hypothetical protein
MTLTLTLPKGVVECYRHLQTRPFAEIGHYLGRMRYTDDAHMPLTLWQSVRPSTSRNI